jgi:hypothetical protein
MSGFEKQGQTAKLTGGRHPHNAVIFARQLSLPSARQPQSK